MGKSGEEGRAKEWRERGGTYNPVSFRNLTNNSPRDANREEKGT